MSYKIIISDIEKCDITYYLVLIIIISGFLIYLAIYNSNKACPKPDPIIKYIPIKQQLKTFKQNKKDPFNVSGTFDPMFNNEKIYLGNNIYSNK